MHVKGKNAFIANFENVDQTLIFSDEKYFLNVFYAKGLLTRSCLTFFPFYPLNTSKYSSYAHLSTVI